MTCVPLILYVMGAAFLALALLFVLEAKVVHPADRRDGLTAEARTGRSRRRAQTRRATAGPAGTGTPRDRRAKAGS